MSYGNMPSITLPTVSSTPGPTYATNVNDALTSIINVLDAKVTPAGIDINSDLSFRSGAAYYAATDLNRAEYTSLGATLSTATYPRTFYFVNGDAYINDAFGNAIRVTQSGSLTAGAATNGIIGAGYNDTSNGVELQWDSAGGVYKMKDGTGASDYASVEMDGAKLSDGSANFVTLKAPAAMSSDLTYTFPTAHPASLTEIVTCSTAGQLDTTLTPSLTSVVTTGAVTVGNTLTVSAGGATITAGGLTVTAGGINVAADTVDFRSAGAFKFKPAGVWIPAAMGQPQDAAAGNPDFGFNGGPWAQSNGGVTSGGYDFYLPLGATCGSGDGVVVTTYADMGATTGNYTVYLKEYNALARTSYTLDSVAHTSTTGVKQDSLSGTVTAGRMPYLHFDFSVSSVADIYVHGAAVTVTRN